MPAVCALVLLAACGSDQPAASAPRAPTVAWRALHNPILSDRDHVVKDQAVVAVGGRWQAAFSFVNRAGDWRIGLRTSRDLAHWSRPTTMPHDATVAGEASPDVERAPDGRFVVTYQSFRTDRDGARPKLYYRTTRDFVRFSDPHRLARTLLATPDDRLIDPVVVWSPAGLLLGFKRGVDQQQFELARSTSGSLAGPWVLVGAPDISIRGDTIENYQFLHLGRRWQLLATTNVGDQPAIFYLAGPVAAPTGWLHWSPGRTLTVPQEAWNAGAGLTGTTFEHANCAYLVGGRRVGGWYYLTYSDAPEKTTFGGEGHGVVAVARSRDLVHWAVPAALSARSSSGPRRLRRLSREGARSPGARRSARGSRASRAARSPG